jgi:hypothetical protein
MSRFAQWFRKCDWRIDFVHGMGFFHHTAAPQAVQMAAPVVRNRALISCHISADRDNRR